MKLKQLLNEVGNKREIEIGYHNEPLVYKVVSQLSTAEAKFEMALLKEYSRRLEYSCQKLI